MNLTPEQRIENIKKRADEINTKKVQAQAQVQLLQKQYDQKVEELKALGITDVSDIPRQIVELENSLNDN